MPDYTLSAKITGDASSYEKAIKSADSATESFSSKVSSVGSKVAGGLRTGLGAAATAIAGVSAALGAGVVAGVKYNASIEQYETSFQTMTGSAEEAADIVQRLAKIGAETPFEFTDLADTTNMLMQFGFTADDAIDSMQMLGDISQGSAEKMGSISRAYAKMRSSQKVTLEDINMMIDAGFNPLQEISEQTGESMQSLYDRISSGSMSVDEVTAAMQRATSEGGKYYQSMQMQAQTINGMISTLKDNAQQLLGEVVGPITEAFGTQLLPAAINAINQLTVAFQEQGFEGLIAVGGQIITNILLGIAQALPNIIMTATQIIQSIITNIQLNLPQLLVAGGQILLSLITGITQILYMVGTLALNIITTLATGLINNAPQIMSSASTILTNFCQEIQGRLPEILQNGAQMISNLLDGILQNAPQVIEQVSTMMQTWLDTVLGALPSILDSGSQIITNLLSGIEANAPEIISQVGNMMSDYINTILENLPAIMESGVNLIMNLLDGLVSTAPEIISQAGSMLAEFIAEIASHLPQILQTGISMIGKLAAGVVRAVPQLIGKIPGIIQRIVSSFAQHDWGSIGLNIIKGIASGVASAAGSLVDAAVSAARNAIETVKGWLGIASPSKRFRDEVGKYMALGMGVGFEDNIPIKDINNALDGAVKQISGHYAEAGKQIKPVNAIVGTSTIAESYQADVSNIFEGTVIQLENIMNMDGKPFYEQSAQYTIRKIGNQQKAFLRAKGAY